ncbi:hypothetical protein BDQ12DRAFT_683819 [Crucibulum laeve]|uniref:Uncharacterized protein n=1 Tax=Crucibulum laeve TaxID=68775 RepID=A0A5C3LZ95_9AGAR|nr:hypothetical protein BDQ12DRAFT_683819 [Crucibulum laeve]
MSSIGALSVSRLHLNYPHTHFYATMFRYRRDFMDLFEMEDVYTSNRFGINCARFARFLTAHRRP